MMLAAISFIWAGMVLGISFLETPVKFTAPSVTLPIGLDIGRHVFGVFNKVEIGTTLVVCGLMFLTRADRSVILPLAIVGTIVVLQTLWLRPVLDARVELILAGQTPPRAPYHIIYVLLELAKCASLIAAGIAGLWALKRVMP